jgi:hypothetical protein
VKKSIPKPRIFRPACTSLREIPCMGCCKFSMPFQSSFWLDIVSSALKGKSNGSCYNAVSRGSCYWKYTSGYSYLAIPISCIPVIQLFLTELPTAKDTISSLFLILLYRFWLFWSAYPLLGILFILYLRLSNLIKRIVIRALLLRFKILLRGIRSSPIE